MFPSIYKNGIPFTPVRTIKVRLFNGIPVYRYTVKYLETPAINIYEERTGVPSLLASSRIHKTLSRALLQKLQLMNHQPTPKNKEMIDFASQEYE